MYAWRASILHGVAPQISLLPPIKCAQRRRRQAWQRTHAAPRRTEGTPRLQPPTPRGARTGWPCERGRRAESRRANRAEWNGDRAQPTLHATAPPKSNGDARRSILLGVLRLVGDDGLQLVDLRGRGGRREGGERQEVKEKRTACSLGKSQRDGRWRQTKQLKSTREQDRAPKQ